MAKVVLVCAEYVAVFSGGFLIFQVLKRGYSILVRLTLSKL